MTLSVSAPTPDATTTSKGKVQLAGDLAGTAAAPTVTQAAGVKSATTTVNTSAATAPTSGQVLTATSGTAATWQTPVTGSGTVNSGTAGQMTYYASTGTAVSGNANATISSAALTLGVGGTTAGSIALSGVTSGSVTMASSPVASGTWTLPSATDVVVGRATTDTLTNKTLTAAKIANAGFLADANGNEQIIFTTTTSAVNEVTLANAATTGTPTISASGGDTNVNIGIYGKNAGVTKTSNRIQLDTTNSTQSGVFMQSGWGFITVVGSVSSLSETVTLPTTFTNLYSIVVQCIGAKAGSDPSSITDLTSDFADVFTQSTLPTTSTFKVYIRTRAGSNFGANERWAYSWIAVGS